MPVSGKGFTGSQRHLHDGVGLLEAGPLDARENLQLLRCLRHLTCGRKKFTPWRTMCVDNTLTELRLTQTSIGKDRVRELGEAWRTTDSAAARPGTLERESKSLKLIRNFPYRGRGRGRRFAPDVRVHPWPGLSA
jgi:hypothetical protein